MNAMNAMAIKLFKQVTEFWDSQDKRRKTIIMAIIASLLVVAVVMSALLNRKEYVTLYSGLSISEAGQIAARLDEMSADYKTQNDTTILVPKQNEARLKMQLASEGYPQSTLNYDIFTNNTDFMTSDYEKRKYLIFQLQDRLQDSIKTIRGINNAIVTISVPEDNSFVLDEDKIPVTASVIVDLDTGVTLDLRQIKGIEELVAKSVPGLKGENVSIIDSTGTILNNNHEDTDIGIITANTKLEMEKKANKELQNRIISLLEPILGKDGVSVAVNVVLDFDKRVSDSITYNPGENGLGVISNFNQSISTSGNTGAAGIPGTTTNTGVPTYQQPQLTEEGSSSQSASVNYLVGQVREQVEQKGGAIKDLTVALMVNRPGMSTQELTQLRQMVAFAVGVNEEKVAITGIDFAAANDLKDKAQQSPNESQKQLSLSDLLQGKYLIPAACALALLIAGVVLLLLRRKKKKKDLVPGAIAEDNSKPELKALEEDIPGAIVLSETREQALRKQIREFSVTNPDIVAQLIKTWIAEDA